MITKTTTLKALFEQIPLDGRFLVDDLVQMQKILKGTKTQMRWVAELPKDAGMGEALRIRGRGRPRCHADSQWYVTCTNGLLIKAPVVPGGLIAVADQEPEVHTWDSLKHAGKSAVKAVRFVETCQRSWTFTLLRVLDIRLQRMSRVDEADAQACGYADRAAFIEAWECCPLHMHGPLKEYDPLMWVATVSLDISEKC